MPQNDPGRYLLCHNYPYSSLYTGILWAEDGGGTGALLLIQDTCCPVSGVAPPAVVTVYVRDQVYDWTAPGEHRNKRFGCTLWNLTESRLHSSASDSGLTCGGGAAAVLRGQGGGGRAGRGHVHGLDRARGRVGSRRRGGGRGFCQSEFLLSLRWKSRATSERFIV